MLISDIIYICIGIICAIIGFIYLIGGVYKWTSLHMHKEITTFQDITLNNLLTPANSATDTALKYYRCKGKLLNETTKSALANKGIQQIHTDNWDIYIPCGYNYVELELAKLKPNANNKFVTAIKGCDLLCSKNSLWYILVNEYGKSKAEQIIPNSWVLNDAENLLDFQKFIASGKGNIFILKNNIQAKQGLLLTDNIPFIEEQWYNTKYKVVQYYLTNPYTINQRKLNIRLYVVIICKPGYNNTRTVDWYLYNEGKCIYTNKKYDPILSIIKPNLEDKEQHFTSLNLDNSLYNRENLPESLQQLRTYMTPEIYDAILSKIIVKLGYIKHAYKNKLCNLTELNKLTNFQLFGIDVIINASDLTPYILEFNKGPEMTFKSPGDSKLKTGLITNMLNMVLGTHTISDSGFIIIA